MVDSIIAVEEGENVEKRLFLSIINGGAVEEKEGQMETGVVTENK